MINVADYAPRFRTPPFRHQLAGVERLVNAKFFGLLDEMGAGKSKQVVDAACVLHVEDEVDAVVVVCPASVRGVWLDPDLGEIQKHSWRPYIATEFHSEALVVHHEQGDESPLLWVVTNYEYVRNPRHRERLLALLKGARILLVLDESSFIKSHKAQQTKACLELGRHAERRVILNGTPLTHSPGDLWPQLQFLSPTILPFRNYYAFRAQYAVMGGWQGKQIVRWINLEDLQDRVKPYVLRREKKDCLDLPEKIKSFVECPLSKTSWQAYKQMREEAVAFIDKHPSLAAQAGVKAMRLAQICAGFLGGVETEEGELTAVPLGEEKLISLRAWLVERLVDDPNLKVICWCRFRKQLEQVYERCQDLIPTFKLYGGQSKDERIAAVKMFSQIADHSEHGLLCAQPQAGGFGLNLTASHTVCYLSNDFSLANRLQSEDRVHRPGQQSVVTYTDFVACGPNGQKTVDHVVLKALQTRSDLATWTARAWRDALVAND